MNATKWSSLTEFAKHLGREGICHVKEDEKDGLMIAWRDTSVAAVNRRNEIAEQEAAEARSGAGEDKMLKKMAKRAQEEAEAKKAIEAKRAAAQAAVQQQVTPPAEGASPTEEKKADSGGGTWPGCHGCCGGGEELQSPLNVSDSRLKTVTDLLKACEIPV